MYESKKEIRELLEMLEEKGQGIEFDFFSIVLSDSSILHSNGTDTYFKIRSRQYDMTDIMLKSISFGILLEQEKNGIKQGSVSAPCGYFHTDDVIDDSTQIETVLRDLREKHQNDKNILTANFDVPDGQINDLVIICVCFGLVIESIGYENISAHQKKHRDKYIIT